MYFMMTCDVINSKKIENFDEKLKEKLKKLNNELENTLVSFTSSRGDEIQGVILYDENIFKNIRKVRGILYPLKLRIGIGIGDIENEKIDYQNSWSMNGEVFHLARNSLLEISKEKIPKTKVLSKEEKITNILNAFFIISDSITEKWSESNWKIAHNYEVTKSYAKTAEVFKISRSAVWQKIKSMKFDAILESEKYLIKELF